MKSFKVRYFAYFKFSQILEQLDFDPQAVGMAVARP